MSSKKLSNQEIQEILDRVNNKLHITNMNADNITGSNPVTASYNAQTKTLTLNSAVITTDNDKDMKTDKQRF